MATTSPARVVRKCAIAAPHVDANPVASPPADATAARKYARPGAQPAADGERAHHDAVSCHQHAAEGSVQRKHPEKAPAGKHPERRRQGETHRASDDDPARAGSFQQAGPDGRGESAQRRHSAAERGHARKPGTQLAKDVEWIEGSGESRGRSPGDLEGEGAAGDVGSQRRQRLLQGRRRGLGVRRRLMLEPQEKHRTEASG
ncbi:MAG: hypothetical protein E6J58_09570 [Deltaproteobacteria bacterium]|nr:MAG: hypothetical protein E6J58_09570 [Deltaproteobacteria bacterium]